MITAYVRVCRGLLTALVVLMCRYGDFGQMFEKMLRDSPDEQWDLFFPVDGHWPTAEQFASYQVPSLTLTLLLHVRVH